MSRNVIDWNQRCSVRSQLCSGPGEVIEPGEWTKAKAAIAAGKKISYEGASGYCDFDENGDVTGAHGLYIVENGAFKQIGFFKQ